MKLKIITFGIIGVLFLWATLQTMMVIDMRSICKELDKIEMTQEEAWKIIWADQKGQARGWVKI